MFAFVDVHASTVYKRGVVNSKAGVYREASNSSILKSDTNGSIYLYKPEAVEVVGESGSYYRIRFLYSGFKYEGYIAKSKLDVNEYTTDDAYEQSLIAAGFPSDYARRLAILHAIHPNWTFAPSFTGKRQGGMDFLEAVQAEADVVSRNLISGSNTSLRSTRDGAYKNGQWISLSGSGWYAASEQTIAFFMDARNFLDESHIFMFENHGFNASTQTPDTVNKVLGGTFMANPFECYNGANFCAVGTHYYVDTFMSAARDKNVSPVHLASRVKQEQGNNGSTLSLGKGYNGEYVGYYNFFNINASGITTQDVILNGLRHAYNKGWNNQHISIYDGSTVVASNYISVGQSTTYYEKFNTINLIYSHQYMQNVKAPYSEAYTTYTSYFNSYTNKDEWDKGTYDFLIPIYSNMGGETSLDASLNADATLKNLSISGGSLNPSFQSSAYNYDCYVDSSLTQVTVEATPTNATAIVKNTGIVNLTGNDTTITVEVTAANGISKSNYVINVHKSTRDETHPNDILNNVGIKITDGYLSNISMGSDVSNIINSIKNKYYFAEVKVTGVSGNEIHDGLVMTGQIVSIKNNNVSVSYRVVLYGDINYDGTTDIRDLLGVQKHLVKSKTLGGEALKAADINKDGSVDIRDLLLVQKSLVGQYTITQG